MDKRAPYAAIFILLALNIALAYSLYQKNAGIEEPVYATNAINFTLLSPDIAYLEVDDFLELQKTYIISYKPLKDLINKLIENRAGTYGIYFEDLTTGAWMGINEREDFVPASLLKTPVVGAVLKKIEEGEMSLNQTFIINSDDLNNKSGTLYARGAGHNITVRQLIKFLINESDNTAENVLRRRLTARDIIEAEAGLGLNLPNNIYPTLGVSPKEYSNIFRSLYHSSYLRRSFSHLALSLMSNTTNSYINAGLPPNVVVAHKFGIYRSLGAFHDCGIVYATQKPYILCVMSNGTDETSAGKIISGISRATYGYVTSK